MIAIVTGASAGLGAQFARQIVEQFPEIDTLWLIARRVGKLEDLAQTIEGKQVICLGLDLCDAKSFKYFADYLAEKRPKVGLLVNNAGCGTLGNLGEVPNETQARMCDLNVRALTLMTNTVLPYMLSGGHIINVSSIASFCPNPRTDRGRRAVSSPCCIPAASALHPVPYAPSDCPISDDCQATFRKKEAPLPRGA